MGFHRSTKEQARRPARRRSAILLAGALLAAAGCLAFVELQVGSPDAAPVAPVVAGDTGGEGTATSAGPLWASSRAEHASASVARRGGTIAMQELAGDLAAATAGGGSPIAVVIARTALRAEPGGRVVEQIGTETEFGSPRVHAIVSHGGRWLEVIATELPNDETGWIRAEDVDVEGVNHSLHASLRERTLDVRVGGRVARSIPIAVGGPGTPTPTGTFAVTDKLRMTEEGPYGCCLLAFTGHQPNIPQGWAGGDRLAVHATPDTATIGQAASLGCFRASDTDMRWLLDEVPLGTPVMVAR